jgi:hypothetical protein
MPAKGCDMAALLAFSMPFLKYMIGFPGVTALQPQSPAHLPLHFLQADEPKFIYTSDRTRKQWRIANLLKTTDLLSQIFDP